jgi:hypothetical protein
MPKILKVITNYFSKQLYQMTFVMDIQPAFDENIEFFYNN